MSLIKAVNNEGQTIPLSCDDTGRLLVAESADNDASLEVEDVRAIDELQRGILVSWALSDQVHISRSTTHTGGDIANRGGYILDNHKVANDSANNFRWFDTRTQPNDATSRLPYVKLDINVGQDGSGDQLFQPFTIGTSHLGNHFNNSANMIDFYTGQLETKAVYFGIMMTDSPSNTSTTSNFMEGHRDLGGPTYTKFLDTETIVAAKKYGGSWTTQSGDSSVVGEIQSTLTFYADKRYFKVVFWSNEDSADNPSRYLKCDIYRTFGKVPFR